MKDAVADTFVIAQRNLRRIPRAPDLLISFTVQPIMFILLFAYVFGGAIETPGYDDYIDFLMPGIVVQAISFGGFVTAIGLSSDLEKGLIDRFRSLPMSRAAVLAGRTLADVATNLLQLTVLVVVGLLIGFTFDANVLEIVAGFALMLLFGYAFSWVFAWCALVASSGESAQAIGFILIFPLSFASSAFVPVESMPDWLQVFAEINPFTTLTDALRALWVGAPAGDDVWLAVLWCVGLTAVFATLSVARYRRAVTR
ncbi:MAG: Efflux ABC transporter, permease protein [uncultured Solirubrobacteraceae bacterium]|uniref:Transport permease protein n=1 Tax=uncultured Solirubrobacteraceae bacterium TaxID=1162706 RepID=A0A6J4STF9_9ACTN|nr:MAG: Efflux ABC transporter, permease protein [uncultured Solirubrobacteraceae bacterium]